jgi:hypothetical protein
MAAPVASGWRSESGCAPVIMNPGYLCREMRTKGSKNYLSTGPGERILKRGAVLQGGQKSV